MSKTVVIVGGVAGGASCATRLRRMDEQARIILLERGPYVSYANCGLPFYVGDIIKEENKLLVATADLFRNRFNIDVRPQNEVLAIDRNAQTVQVKDQNDEQYTIGYDKLVLSPGAKPYLPAIPGIDLAGIFTVRTVPDSRLIRSWIDDQNVVHATIIGGGFIGLEMAENLIHRSIEVDIIEKGPQIMAHFDPEIALQMHQHLQKNGVSIRLNESVKKIHKNSEGLSIEIENSPDLETDMVILAIGLQPENSLAKACGLGLGKQGHIIVDDKMQTDDPNILAIGDAIEIKNYVTSLSGTVPLAGPANRQGRLAADIICGRPRHFRGVQGTSICGAFGLTMACTGINERTLLDAKVGDYNAIYLHPADHVGYYPGAKNMHLKLLSRKKDGKILGAQAIGEAGVERRIDVISAMMQMNATVFDLEEAELCYAPQYGAAKDPVNMAGMIGANALRNDLDIESWAQTLLLTHLSSPGLKAEIEVQSWTEIAQEQCTILDVREPHEFKAGHIPGSMNLPLNQIREKLHKIPGDLPVLVTCAVGLRAYNGLCILRQNGYDARLLSGGYKTFANLRDCGRII